MSFDAGDYESDYDDTGSDSEVNNYHDDEVSDYRDDYGDFRSDSEVSDDEDEVWNNVPGLVQVRLPSLFDPSIPMTRQIARELELNAIAALTLALSTRSPPEKNQT
jgi:hypothetical protein